MAPSTTPSRRRSGAQARRSVCPPAAPSKDRARPSAITGPVSSASGSSASAVPSADAAWATKSAPCAQAQRMPPLDRLDGDAVEQQREERGKWRQRRDRLGAELHQALNLVDRQPDRARRVHAVDDDDARGFGWGIAAQQRGEIEE